MKKLIFALTVLTLIIVSVSGAGITSSIIKKKSNTENTENTEKAEDISAFSEYSCKDAVTVMIYTNEKLLSLYTVDLEKKEISRPDANVFSKVAYTYRREYLEFLSERQSCEKARNEYTDLTGISCNFASFDLESACEIVEGIDNIKVVFESPCQTSFGIYENEVEFDKAMIKSAFLSSDYSKDALFFDKLFLSAFEKMRSGLNIKNVAKITALCIKNAICDIRLTDVPMMIAKSKKVDLSTVKEI